MFNKYSTYTGWSKSLCGPDDYNTLVSCTETFWSPCTSTMQPAWFRTKQISLNEWHLWCIVYSPWVGQSAGKVLGGKDHLKMLCLIPSMYNFTQRLSILRGKVGGDVRFEQFVTSVTLRLASHFLLCTGKTVFVV